MNWKTATPKEVVRACDKAAQRGKKIYVDPLWLMVLIADHQRLTDERIVRIDVCPTCGGLPDNGFSREIPPAPYECSKCEEKRNKVNQ